MSSMTSHRSTRPVTLQEITIRTLLLLLLLATGAKSFDEPRTFTTVLSATSSHATDYSVIIKSKNQFDREVYKVKLAGSLYKHILRLRWNYFKLPSGKMPTCIDAYLTINIGCGINKREVGTFCGVEKPHDIYSFNGCIELEWKTKLTFGYSGHFIAFAEKVSRSSIKSTPNQCNKGAMTAKSGTVFVNSLSISARQLFVQRCSFEIKAGNSNDAIQINKMDSYITPSYNGYQYRSKGERYNILGQGTSHVIIELKTNFLPSSEYFMIGWVTFPSQSPTPHFPSKSDFLTKGEIAGLVAALVLLSAVIPLILRGIYMRKRSLAEPHAENNGNNTLTRAADLNQVSSIGDCDVQFARDAVLSMPPPPKYADVIAEESPQPPPKYEDVFP